jgi:hypothetical protein
MFDQGNARRKCNKPGTGATVKLGSTAPANGRETGFDARCGNDDSKGVVGVGHTSWIMVSNDRNG